MRRTVSAVAAAVLLLAPASALAECSWVLWGETTESGRLVFPMDGFKTREECHAAIQAFLQRKRGEGGIFYCLPDTVDPRGPKGK